LRESEEEIFGAMDSACRRCIRKAEKSGVTIEESSDPEFANEYYSQLKEVFAKQSLVPTYGIQRVRSLINHLHPTGRLLLLRARDPKGKCIATGIFPGFNKIAEFWGNASVKSGQIWRPNEYMHWYVMRYWKKRGVEVYDWGGEAAYKEKYGCVRVDVPWLTKSRHKVIGRLRDEVKKMHARKQRLLGRLAKERQLSTE
jgi:lipid II:glycine glycyltransferase (peptidoglycan interpeptide bridge formation enzyme)